jgi:hypothetical protein
MIGTNMVIKQVTNNKQKNKFSCRLKHPRAVAICNQMKRDSKLSKYIERLILRDSLTIGTDKKSLSEYKKKLMDEIRTERNIIDTEIKRLKALKESHIYSLQQQLEHVNKLLEEKK